MFFNWHDNNDVFNVFKNICWKLSKDDCINFLNDCWCSYISISKSIRISYFNRVILYFILSSTWIDIHWKSHCFVANLCDFFFLSWLIRMWIYIGIFRESQSEYVDNFSTFLRVKTFIFVKFIRVIYALEWGLFKTLVREWFYFNLSKFLELTGSSFKLREMTILMYAFL